MSIVMIAAMVAFVLALVHASIVNGWRSAIGRARPRGTDEATAPDLPAITVLVPARDAEGTLAALLQDLHAQRFPRERMDVLVVDDHSTDNTAAIARGMMRQWPGLRVIALEGAEGKKAAITEGVRHATGELILITDADARCGPDRLAALARFWSRSEHDMVLLPVITTGRGILGFLQEEEQFALLGALAGSAFEGHPVLAGGANMAFTRSAFEAVRGYEGDGWASGDDLFLLKRMLRAGMRIGCLLDPAVVVEVPAEPDLPAMFVQRLRWAGKMHAVGGPGTRSGALAVLLPWILLAVTVFAVISLDLGGGFLRTWALLAAAWLLWIVPVIGLVNAAKRALGVRPAPFRSLLALLVFPLYSLPVALASFVVRARWKGRPA